MDLHRGLYRVDRGYDDPPAPGCHRGCERHHPHAPPRVPEKFLDTFVGGGVAESGQRALEKGWQEP